MASCEFCKGQLWALHFLPVAWVLSVRQVKDNGFYYVKLLFANILDAERGAPSFSVDVAGVPFLRSYSGCAGGPLTACEEEILLPVEDGLLEVVFRPGGAAPAFVSGMAVSTLDPLPQPCVLPANRPGLDGVLILRGRKYTSGHISCQEQAADSIASAHESDFHLPSPLWWRR